LERVPVAATATILIAEDDPDIRHVLHELLQDEGYVPLIVKDGQEALDVVLTQHVDLILLDLQMPVLDGEGFCTVYHERGGTAPVVLVTAASPTLVESALTACGAAGYISKPFDLNDVIEAVAKHLPAAR
jgi:CheY-like chemotaxis protein